MHKTTSQQYAQAWHALLLESTPDTWPTVSQQVLNYLQKSGDLKLLPSILEHISTYENKRTNTTAVQVTLSHRMNAEEIWAHAKRALPNTQLHISLSLDPNVLGGLIMETSDRRINISAQNQLSQLAHVMTQL